jgi:hypothetical protein
MRFFHTQVCKKRNMKIRGIKFGKTQQDEYDVPSDSRSQIKQTHLLVQLNIMNW